MTQEEKEFVRFEFEPQLRDNIKWLFERQSIDGLFPVFFVLYSYRHNLPITFEEESIKYAKGADELQDRLYEASLLALGGDTGQFAYLWDVQDLIESIDTALYIETYPKLIDYILCMTDLVAGTQLQPNSRIAYTIGQILKERGCKTVFGAYSGIGIYALACRGMKYTGAEPYAPANLIADVLCDAFDVKKGEFMNVNPLNEWTRRRFDAVIGNLPVDADFFNIYRANSFLRQFNQIQNEFISKLIKRKTARKIAALLVHFEFANSAGYDVTRKLICDNGMLDTVIALPEDIFQKSLVPTYLVILDMKGGHTSAVFMDATKSKRRQTASYYTYMANLYDLRECVKDNERVVVSYEQIERAAWSFNPAIYIQNAVCREGQELVRLGDLVSVYSGKMVKGERYIGYESLSETFSKAASGIIPSAPDKYENALVEGPSVLVALTRGSRRETQTLKCGICRDYGTYSVTFFLTVLKPDPEKILPDYLVLALMSDPSFAPYFKSIQEYYTDTVRSAHILERRIPIYTDLAAQKKAVMDALGRSDMAEMSYNIVVAGAGENLAKYRSAFTKYGCNILASAETVEGPEGLERLLEEVSRDKAPVSKRAEAIVFLTDIPLNGKDDIEAFSGLDAILDLRLLYEKKGLKFFASSNSSLDDIRKAGTISSRRLKPLEDGHFFMTIDDGKPADALAASVREELDRELSPESRIRSRHRNAFKAAEWLDEAYPDSDMRAAETLSEFLMASEEGIDTSRNLSDLRNLAHRIIEILVRCRAVPPIDNGAIPHLLYDRSFENKRDGKVYIQDVQIMRRSLSSSLISLIDIGNEGTHTFRTSANLGSSMLQTLLEFVTWFYEKREEFSSAILTNYWHIDSEYERNWEETTGPAKLHTIGGKAHWTCGDVHLFTPPTVDIQEGDIVTIRRRSEDIGKVRIPGVKYFAFPKGYNNQNPDGYTIDTSGRIVDKPQ